MKTARLLLPIASFVVAGSVARYWPVASGPAERGKIPASDAMGTTGVRSGTNPGKTASVAPGTVSPAASINGVSQAPPTIDEVFAATGLDRMLLMARFIQTASAADLAAVIDRAAEDKIYETAFTDQAWLRWVELDLEGALKHSNSSPAWWAYAKLDPEAALDRALMARLLQEYVVVPVQSQPDRLGAVLNSIGQGDPALARRLLAEHPEANTAYGESFVLSGILAGLKKTDPAAATALALEKGGGHLDTQFKNWMERDPEQALAWMRGLTHPASRRRVEDLAMTQLIASDPAAGLEAAWYLPAGKRQTNHTVEAITALARQDPKAARAAAEAISAPHARQQALAALAGSLAGTDPAAAGALISSLDWKLLGNSYPTQWSYVSVDSKDSSGGYSGEQASETTLTKLMAAAPQVTADALAAQASASDSPFGPFLTAVPLSSAMQKWAAVQPEAASTWLKNQPPGVARDQGIEGLTTWLTSGSAEPDYTAALAWAGAASEAQQFELYQRTISPWRRKDPQAAAAAVETLSISPENRDRLRRSLNPVPNDPFVK